MKGHSAHGGHGMGQRQPRFARGDGPWWGSGYGTAWDPAYNQTVVLITNGDPDGSDGEYDDVEDPLRTGQPAFPALAGMSSRPCCSSCAGSSGSCRRNTGALGALADITTDLLTSPLVLLATGGILYYVLVHKKKRRANPARRRRRR